MSFYYLISKKKNPKNIEIFTTLLWFLWLFKKFSKKKKEFFLAIYKKKIQKTSKYLRNYAASSNFSRNLGEKKIIFQKYFPKKIQKTSNYLQKKKTPFNNFQKIIQKKNIKILNH